MQEVDFCLFRLSAHGLNEELGKHRGREGKTECSLCGDECENVSYVFGSVQHIAVLYEEASRVVKR